MTQEEVANQKGIEHAVKADVAKSKIKKGKKYLIDILGQSVVHKVYKDKVKYDKYCLKMLNRRAQDENINNFKIRDLHLGERREVMEACPKSTRAGKPLEEQDLIIKLNLLATKKKKNVDDLQDHFKSTKRHLEDLVVSSLQFMWRFRNLRRPYQELQFSLVSNAKLNNVDLFSEAEMKCFTSKRKAGIVVKLIVDALLQRFLPLARHRIETSQAQAFEFEFNVEATQEGIFYINGVDKITKKVCNESYLRYVRSFIIVKQELRAADIQQDNSTKWWKNNSWGEKLRPISGAFSVGAWF
ncbi:hypothetical protein Tco_1548455 [Tanacetum coccineum]